MPVLKRYLATIAKLSLCLAQCIIWLQSWVFISEYDLWLARKEWECLLLKKTSLWSPWPFTIAKKINPLNNEVTHCRPLPFSFDLWPLTFDLSHFPSQSPIATHQPRRWRQPPATPFLPLPDSSPRLDGLCTVTQGRPKAAGQNKQAGSGHHCTGKVGGGGGGWGY